MLKRKHDNININEDKPKERRIVTWTQQEDDILREQISKHGTNNWTIIASKFKDKTTRQCRRRWYTYLNSDFKKGGWSPEEDMLLCEAQKIFGNRWTEIAKVVSGRTDNAVKNRFSTLCKKKAKREALAKENSNPSLNASNKRVVVDNKFCSSGIVDIPSPFKTSRRAHIPNRVENFISGNILHNDRGTKKQQLRAPFAVLAQNDSNVDNLLVSREAVINGTRLCLLHFKMFTSRNSDINVEFVDTNLDFNQMKCFSSTIVDRVNIHFRCCQRLAVLWFRILMECSKMTHPYLAIGGSLLRHLVDKKTEGTFIRKDDPKVAALVRQAELLSSLAVKVNVDNTEQSLEKAWKVLQKYIGKKKVSNELKCKITDADLQLDDLKEVMEDSKSNKGVHLDRRQPDMYDSSSSSEYSTDSTSLSQAANDQGEQSQPETCAMHEDIRPAAQSLQLGDIICVDVAGTLDIPCTAAYQESNSPVEVTPNFRSLASLIGETSSPLLATPIFRSLASTITSPQFSESEKHFLLKTLGIESPAHNNINNSMQPPPCRKALLQGL